MQVVTGALCHTFQQSPVDPVNDRAVKLPRTVKAHAVLFQVCYEYILHLQITPRMQQRNRIHEAFERARAEMEAQIARHFRQNVLQPRHIETGRQHQIRHILKSHHLLFEPDRLPEIRPERHPAPAVTAKSGPIASSFSAVARISLTGILNFSEICAASRIGTYARICT